MKLNHIGFACKNIADSIKYINSLYQVKEISDFIYDEEQQATLCYITLKDSVAIELVSGETVSGYVKNGISLYHVCYECDDIYKTIEIFKNNGNTVVCNPVRAKLFNGRLVSFLHTELGLVELLEVKENSNQAGFEMEHIAQTATANIVLLSNFTVTPLQKYLLYYNDTLKTNYNIVMAPYNQIFQQFLSPESLINKNEVGYNVILISIEEWFHYADCESTDYEERMKATAKEFTEAILNHLIYCKAQNFIIFTPPSSKFHDNISKQKIGEEAENNIHSVLEEAHISYISSKEILSLLGNTKYDSSYSNKIAHIPYVERVYAAIASKLMRKLLCMESYPYKVIVVDCDNTLWEGNCADVLDGRVEISEGKKYLQRFLVDQMEKGMLLCICSKNNEKEVMKVFETNPDMLLKKEHITAFKVNWLNKSDNILDLADKLNLSLDSFIFMDDSPYECEEVSQAYPEVLALQIPASDLEIIKFLEDLWVFDKDNVVVNSGARTKYYKENFLREEERQKAITFAEYINGLCINIFISSMKEEEIGRISELTKRTNQFNLSAKKRSEYELRELFNKGYQCDVIYVNDRFGSYGLVGVIIYKAEGANLRVDSFLLSCRALGRGVENEIMIHLGKTARKCNKDTIVFEYKDNQKNQPAYYFVSEIGKDIKNIGQENQEILVNTSKACSYQFVYKNNDQELVRKKDTNTVHYTFHRGKAMQDLISVDNLMATVIERTENRSTDEKWVANFRWNGLDEYILKLYKVVLNMNDMDMEESFVELGGDSIRAVKIVSDIFSRYNIEISIQNIFDYNLREIIKFVKCKQSLKDEMNSSEGIQDNTFKDIVKHVHFEQKSKFPLSFCQEALMQHELMDMKTFVYNMPWIFQIKGKFNTEALHYAFRKVFEKNDVFRTVFKEEEGLLYQEVMNDMDVMIEKLYLTKEEDISQIIRQEETMKFDISKGPLMRTVLIQTDMDSYLMILTIHHIIFDGWSYSLLFKDLSTFYQEYISYGEPFNQQLLPIRYADYVIWEREYSKTERMQQQIQYWKKQLKGLQLHEIPRDTNHTFQEAYEGLYLPIELNQKVVEKLRNICIRQSTTLYTGILCVFDLLLYSLIQSSDVAVGTVVAMRNAKELEDIIGLFINTIVMRSKIKDEDSFIEFLQNNRKVVMEGFSNKDAYFGDVINASASTMPENKDNPFYHAMLLFQNTPKNSFTIEGLEIRKYQEGYNIARGDLILELEEKEDILIGGFYYNTSYFAKETIQGYAARLEEILVNSIENPEKRINDIISNFRKSTWEG